MEDKINIEYERIKNIFQECDEKQLQLIDGTILEAARLKIELDDLHTLVNEAGLLKVHTKDKTLQKELPVSKMIVKVRANYLNYIAKLSNLLGKNLDDEDEDGLNDYE